MSSSSFDVAILKTEVLEAIPGAWTPDQYRQLLSAMDYGDTAGMSDADLLDMCLMSIQGIEPDDAAEAVLACRFGKRMRPGQVRNLAQDMMTEKKWEHGADMEDHADFFHCGSLLYAARPDDFPTPDAVRVELLVTARDKEARGVLQAPLTAAFVVRLLADGMPESSVMHRLLEDELAEGPFAEAAMILWNCTQQPATGDALKLEVVSSGHWFDALAETTSYVSKDPQRD